MSSIRSARICAAWKSASPSPSRSRADEIRGRAAGLCHRSRRAGAYARSRQGARRAHRRRCRAARGRGRSRRLRHEGEEEASRRGGCADDCARARRRRGTRRRRRRRRRGGRNGGEHDAPPHEHEPGTSEPEHAQDQDHEQIAAKPHRATNRRPTAITTMPRMTKPANRGRIRRAGPRTIAAKTATRATANDGDAGAAAAAAGAIVNAAATARHGRQRWPRRRAGSRTSRYPTDTFASTEELTTPPSAEPDLSNAVADLDAPTPAQRQQPVHAEEPPARTARRTDAPALHRARARAGRRQRRGDGGATVTSIRRRPHLSRIQSPKTARAEDRASRAAPAGGPAALPAA